MATIKSKIMLGLLLGAVVIVGLAHMADLPKVVSAVQAVEWNWLPLILGLTSFNYLLRFFKWHYYLRQVGLYNIGWRDSLKVFLGGFAMTVTPGKVGEAFKSLWLKNLTGAGMARTLPVVAAERLSDALACALLASVGVFAYPNYWPAFAAILAVMLGGIAVIQLRPLSLWLLRLAERWPLVSRFAHSLRAFYESSFELLRLRNPVVAVGLGTISWAGAGAAFSLVGRDAGPHRRAAARTGGLGFAADSLLHIVVRRDAGLFDVGPLSPPTVSRSPASSPYLTHRRSITAKRELIRNMSSETRNPKSDTRHWQVELHSHTCASQDSLVTPQEYVAACRRKGIDRAAITDHNALEGALAAQKIAPDLIIVGEEIKTDAGEIIAYFLRELVPPYLPVREAIARVRAQGGVVGVSHPCDSLRREAMGAARLLPIIDLVDALEVFNARCVRPADNDAARDLARQHGKLMFAGSDAHTALELGQAVTLLPPFASPQAFLAGLARAEIRGRLSSPFVHFSSTYAKLVKRLARR